MDSNYFFGLPLKHNFVEYVYLNGLFLPHEIKGVRSLWKDQETVKATLSGDEKYNDELRKSSVMSIGSESEYKWVYDRLASASIQTNNERYWFDLLGFHENLQLTRYSTGDFFDWHLDFGAGQSSMRKLSITVQLSDPDEYEGSKGTAIVFPSFIMHRVTPITKGTRQSIVGWVSGTPYR